MIELKSCRVILALLVGVASWGAPAGTPRTPWVGGELPDEGTLACRAGEADNPAPKEVPPTLIVEYSKPRAWVRVTLGGKSFEKSNPLLSDGPKAWGGDIERDGWSVNVAMAPKIRGWTWFTMANDRIDWRGYCELQE